MSAPTSYQLLGIRFTPPSEFVMEEGMLSLRAPAPVDPRPGLRTAIRPNLIIHRRTVPGEPTLDLMTGELCAELVNSVLGMEKLATDAFRFDDTSEGRLISFELPAPGGATVRQYQAVRLDSSKLTTLTLTVDGASLTDSLEKFYLQSLASASISQEIHTGG